MTNKNCLNCGKKLTDKFCSGCGQKTDTHRITFKNFISHDLLHGTFHIERGILFTAKEALLRPGKAALDYIAGKRKRYYNVFYLILITIGVMLFTRHVDELFTTQSAEIVPEKVYLNEASRKFDELFSQKSKLILLLFLPFSALNSYILFRRKKLNFSEHTILSGMILLGILLISTIGNFIFLLNIPLQFSWMFLSWLVAACILFYLGFAYFNAFSTEYSKWGISYRIVLFFALICLEMFILFLILFGFFSNWKFGEVSLSPFN